MNAFYIQVTLQRLPLVTTQLAKIP